MTRTPRPTPAISFAVCWLACSVSGIGCVRQNPLFGEQNGSGAATDAREPPLPTTNATSRGTSTSGATSFDDSANNTTQTNASTPDDTTGLPRFDLGGASTGPNRDVDDGPNSDASSGMPRRDDAVLFATPATNGVFASKDGDAWDGAVAHCIDSAARAGFRLPGPCGMVWPFLAVDGVALEELPALPGGQPLVEATIVGPDGTPVAESFAALAAGEVYPQMQASVSEHLGIGGGLDTWAGDPSLDGGPSMGTCANWASAEATGRTRGYTENASFVLEVDQPCSEPISILCLCF